MEITIEKNIPLNNSRGLKEDLSFIDTMEVGDSFLYPYKSRQSFMGKMRKYSLVKKNGAEFTSREENAQKQNVRIWRIK